VKYELEAQLNVIIEGLPDGVKADVILQELDEGNQPTGTQYALTESTLVKGLKPSRYTFLSKDVRTSQLFSAFPTQKEVLVVELEPGSKNAEKINYAANINVARTMGSASAVVTDGKMIAVSSLRSQLGYEQCDLNIRCTGTVDILELKKDGSWTLLKTLEPTYEITRSMDNFNYFGQSIAVSGDMVMVGAPEDKNKRGAVYIFKKDQGGTDNWGLFQTLELPWYNVKYPGNERFGWSMVTDGSTLLVGARLDSVDTNENGDYDCGSVFEPSECYVGSVYAFQQDEGGYWGFVKKFLAKQPIQQSGFGESIDVDGDTIIIGANYGGERADFGRYGIAYVYERHQGGQNNWGEVATLSPSHTSPYPDNFGISVSVEGDRIAVGSPTGLPDINLDGTINCKKSDDENYQGYLGDECSGGTVYIYQKKAGEPIWKQTQVLSGTKYYGLSAFGHDVEIDQERVFVGAPGQNIVYTFDLNSAQVKMQKAHVAKDYYNFGVKLAVEQGKVVAVASSETRYGDFTYKNNALYILSSPDF
jgi:FG-GAP repeat